MGELDALEDDLAMEAAAPGATPAYLQVSGAAGKRWRRRWWGAAWQWCSTGRQLQRIPPSSSSCSERLHPFLCSLRPLRMLTCRRCRRGSRHRRRRRRTSSGCRPSRSARSGPSQHRRPAMRSAAVAAARLAPPVPSVPLPPRTTDRLYNQPPLSPALTSPLALCTAPSVNASNLRPIWQCAFVAPDGRGGTRWHGSRSGDRAGRKGSVGRQQGRCLNEFRLGMRFALLGQLMRRGSAVNRVVRRCRGVEA